MHPTLTRAARRGWPRREPRLAVVGRAAAYVILAAAVLAVCSVLFERAAPNGFRPSQFLQAAARP